MCSDTFEIAVDHAMLYEVGGFWELTPEVELGLVNTKSQRRAVGYVDDPLDRGGETKFGIAKNANPDVDIYNLDWQGAKDIYYNRYWLEASCDKLPPRVAILHFDGCVNHGISRATKFMQRALNLFDDGIIGPQTIESANNEDPIKLCFDICNQREQFYRDIVARKPNQSRYLNGWLRRIEEMKAFTCDPDVDFS